MKLKLLQIAGIVSYEMRMLWRGRALLVIILAILMLGVLSAIITKQETASMPLQTTIASVGSMTWSVLSIVLMFLLPVVVADTIPKDRQLGVSELLDALPVTRGIYLLGKLLGVYWSIFTSLIALMLIIGVCYQFLLGEFAWGDYFGMWFFGAGGLVILNTGLGVLLPAGQPTRRRAVVLMIAVFVLSFLIGGNISRTAATYLSPVRPPFLMYYMAGPYGPFAHTLFKAADIQLSFLVGLLELIIVGVVVWAWPRWRESRILRGG